MEQKWVNSILIVCILLVVFQVLSTYMHYSNKRELEKGLEPESVIKPQVENPEAVENLKSEESQINSPKTFEIFLYERSVKPKTLVIMQGDKVKWTNKGKNRRRFWINEEIYSDLLEPEQSYEYVFDKKGTYSYRDVFNGLVRGNVTVKKREINPLTGNILKNVPTKYKTIVGAQIVLLAIGVALFLYPYKSKKHKKTKKK
ncbi:MAG: hypothetical protein MAG795_01073 [Candidatus Woesearchaeota archaeon]|nr:hypothetical protein [Candidatus Woesearchaeota archaeon]